MRKSDLPAYKDPIFYIEVVVILAIAIGVLMLLGGIHHIAG